MVTLPMVTLDTTIADLYRRANPKHANKRIGQVLSGTNSAIPLSEDFPRNVKYLYQDTPFNTLPKEELTSKNAELQRSLAMKYLALVPQRDAFISGDTAVVMFNIDQTEEQIAHDQREAAKTIQVLAKEQQPQLIFCPGPAKMPLRENNVDMVACKLALDPLEQVPTTVPLDTHWYINSKAALARSGLPTPHCDLIEVEGYSIAADRCCEACKAGDAYYVPPECTASRGKWVEAQTERIVNQIKNRAIPFVLKNQQTFGGAGTYVVNSEEKRTMVAELFADGLLRKLISQVTEQNHHLKPGTVLLSDLVADPVGDYGLTFFVTETGDAIFMAVSEQMINSKHAWIGSTINYDHQKQLEAKFTPIMKQTAGWLHGQGYCGPAGADILETSTSAPYPSFHIVDLNVRTSGSLCLPLLRGHYTSRGLQSASSFSITVEASREDFIRKWRDEFESGRMCILSWYEDAQAGHSIADVAVGGEDQQRLQEEITRVRVNTLEVTF